MDEQADVVQIRLYNSSNVMALLSEFQCAERVLATWGSKAGRSEVHFEVRFDDGHVVKGRHEFFRNGKRRCLLATHIRRLLRQPEASANPYPSPSPSL